MNTKQTIADEAFNATLNTRAARIFDDHINYNPYKYEAFMEKISSINLELKELPINKKELVYIKSAMKMSLADDFNDPYPEIKQYSILYMRHFYYEDSTK